MKTIQPNKFIPFKCIEVDTEKELNDVRLRVFFAVVAKNENLSVSDIYETDVCISFRIYKNRQTVRFYSVPK